METQHLKAFVWVAEARSFSLAAEKLHITQPAVSKRVALLEEYLSTELFDRIGRSVGLTESGRALLPQARAILQNLLEAEQSVRDLSGEVSGRLRLATSHHIGLHRLPPALGHFSKAFPAVHIDIEFMDSEQAYELVAQGKVEVGIVTMAPVQPDNIIAAPIWQDALEFMVATEHELAAQSKCTLQQLSNYPATLPGLNTYTGQIVKRLFDQHQLKLQVPLATNYLETIRMMTSIGLGWTVLPRTMLDKSLLALEVQDISIARSLGIIYHRNRSLSRAAQAFMDAVSTHGEMC
ncbi:MAG: LysR family transcriptional regulator [Halieaceae bacterium]|nr:LysR family transcriptional regulator [Halieaceae bacterium]